MRTFYRYFEKAKFHVNNNNNKITINHCWLFLSFLLSSGFAARSYLQY